MSKYRKDFVTNSSSSSYVCDICGEDASGWDMGLEDAGMYECENGHTICEDEILEEINYKDYLESQIENGDVELMNRINDEDEDLEDLAYQYEIRYYLPEKYCPICQFISYSESDMYKYLSKLYNISPDVVFAKVKEGNKRRKKLYDSEYIEYVCNEFDLVINSVINEIKAKFSTYKAFKEFLRDN